MPQVIIPAMDETQRQAFLEAQQEVSIAQTFGRLRLDINTETSTGARENKESPERVTLQIKEMRAGLQEAQNIISSIAVIQEELDQGRAVLNERRGIPRIEEAQTLRTHHYPMDDHMTEAQEAEFNQDINDINAAQRQGHCKFESLLNDWAEILFRYQVSDNAPQKRQTLDSIQRVINHVHSGRAVRIEIPGAAIMLMPRWKLDRKTEAAETEPALQPVS